MRTCPECGREAIAQYQTTCTYCGAPLHKSDFETESSEETRTLTEGLDKMGIGGCSLLVLSIFFIFFLLKWGILFLDPWEAILYSLCFGSLIVLCIIDLYR